MCSTNARARRRTEDRESGERESTEGIVVGVEGERKGNGADGGARGKVEEARREGQGFQLDGANSDPEFILSISARWSGKELGAALGLAVRYINAAELAASSPRGNARAEPRRSETTDRSRA